MTPNVPWLDQFFVKIQPLFKTLNKTIQLFHLQTIYQDIKSQMLLLATKQFNISKSFTSI